MPSGPDAPVSFLSGRATRYTPRRESGAEPLPLCGRATAVRWVVGLRYHPSGVYGLLCKPRATVLRRCCATFFLPLLRHPKDYRPRPVAGVTAVR